ncbi:GVIN1-like protein, partial [Mya arenaria]
MEPKTQAALLDQHFKTQVPVPKVSVQKAPPAPQRVSRSFDARVDKKPKPHYDQNRMFQKPPQSLCTMSDPSTGKKESDDQDHPQSVFDPHTRTKQEQQNTTKEEPYEGISNLLRRLGLQKRSDNHITVHEAMVVNIKTQTEEEMSFNQLPWIMLRNIIAVNYTARDYTQIYSRNTVTTSESRKQANSDLRRRFGKDSEIEDASFGVEHLIREVGHICDSSQHLQNDLSRFELPPAEDIADLVANLVLDGESLEIIDGDNVFFPSKWIAMVFKKIDEKSGQGRIMTLSVLGLQSSGKSTLLNSMFGVHFSVSSGRCTRGINAQLLPVNQTHTNKIQHVLIIDSEGLRAPELDSATNIGKRDNELATFVTGLGDLTLMNIMGENFSDMRDILQIVVHAFLRLKLANGALKTGQTCMFVHHNVTDKSASDSMKDRFLKLIQILDAVTADAAETE